MNLPILYPIYVYKKQSRWIGHTVEIEWYLQWKD